MFRVKMLAVLAGMIAALAVSAAPAFADWEANQAANKEEKGQGKVIVLASGEFVDENNKVFCDKEGIEAEWHIQTKGVINEHEKGKKQLQTKRGPQLQFKVKWEKTVTPVTHCHAKILGGLEVEAKVKQCLLHLRQLPGELKATGGSSSECSFTAAGCEVKVPEGKETTPESNTGKNVGLSEVILKNNGNNQNDKIAVKGIEAFGPGGLCPGNQTNAELIGGEFEVIGANAV